MLRTARNGVPWPVHTCARAVVSMSVLSASGKTSRVAPTFSAVTNEPPESMVPRHSCRPSSAVRRSAAVTRGSAAVKDSGIPGTCPGAYPKAVASASA